MRPQEVKNNGSFDNVIKSWSINDGDYIKKSLSGEETFQLYRKKEKIKKFFVVFFLILSGYIGIIFILMQLSKI